MYKVEIDNRGNIYSYGFIIRRVFTNHFSPEYEVLLENKKLTSFKLLERAIAFTFKCNGGKDV